MKILKDFRNDLLKRQEVRVLVEAEKNPGFDEMRKQVSEQVGKPEENIDVYNIKGGFGSHEFKIDAYVYDSKEDLEKFARKAKKKKSKLTSESKSAKAIAPKSEPIETSVEEKPEQEQKGAKKQKQAEEEVKKP